MHQFQKERAYSQVCKANMLSLYKYLAQYALDHDDKLPPTAGEFWYRDASRYIKSYAILICPKDKGTNKSSYLLVPQAAGKSLNSLTDKVILLENSPRHNGIAHALLSDGTVIDVKGVLIKNYR